MAEVAELFLYHLDDFLHSSSFSSSSSSEHDSEPGGLHEFEPDGEEIYEASFFFPRAQESDPFDINPVQEIHDGLGGLEGLRVIGLDSDSGGSEASEIEPFRWDSIGIEEEDEVRNEIGDFDWQEEARNDIGMTDFDWEEVERGLHADERELLSMVVGNTYSEETADDDDEEEEDEERARERNLIMDIGGEIQDDLEMVRNIGWEEVLLSDGLDQELESVVDSVHMSEYEILSGQIDIAIQRGSPPAAKCVVKSLPSITLTEEDIKRDRSSCAVCKDEMEVKEKITKLPCNHLYHKYCILPWLKIRNSCPVCRYELATDDPDYENWKAFRNDGSSSDLIDGLVESLDSFHLDWSV